MKLLAKYFSVLHRHPFRTKVISSICIFSFADFMTQIYEFNTKKLKSASHFSWDYARTGRMTIFGGLITSWIHVWWGYLDRTVEKYISEQTNHYANTFTKVFLDQIIGSPLFNIAFFSSQHILQGKPCDQTLIETVQTRVPTQLQRHYCFWPWVHLVNFGMLPLHNRVIVHNILTIGWTAYLSKCEQDFENEAENVKAYMEVQSNPGTI